MLLSIKIVEHPISKNIVDEATEKAVMEYAVAQSAHGQRRTSNEVRKQGVFIFISSDNGVRSIWLRHESEGKKSYKFISAKLNDRYTHCRFNFARKAKGKSVLYIC